jgi:hypothetical protein
MCFCQSEFKESDTIEGETIEDSLVIVMHCGANVGSSETQNYAFITLMFTAEGRDIKNLPRELLTMKDGEENRASERKS